MSGRRIAVLASGRGSNFEALCTADLGDASVVLLATDNPKAEALIKAKRLGIEKAVFDPGPHAVHPRPEWRLPSRLFSRTGGSIWSVWPAS